MKVSIIITSYNYGEFLERSIRSCLTQNWESKNFEVICIDDRSEDRSIDIMKKYSLRHENFRYHVNAENVGVAGSANAGIRLAEGRYFVRVDADDYVSRDFARLMCMALEDNSNDYLGVTCDYYLVTDTEEKIKRVQHQIEPISCAMMYRMDRFVNVHNVYDPSFRHREEEALRKQMGVDYKLLHLPLALYRYRMHDRNKTKNLEEMSKAELNLRYV